MKIIEVIQLNEVGVEPIPGMIGQYRVIYPPEFNKTPDGPLSRAAADKKFADAELEFRNRRAQSYIDRKEAEKDAKKNSGSRGRGRSRRGSTTPTTPASDTDNKSSTEPKKDLTKGLKPDEKTGVWKKMKGFLNAGGKSVAGKLGGLLIATLLTSKNLYDEFMLMVDQYVQSGCNRDSYVRHAEQNIRIALVEGVRDLLSGALGGFASVAAMLAIVPGLGWLASAGVGVLGGILGMVLGKLAMDEDKVLKIADWLKETFIRDLTGLLNVIDDALEEMGYDLVSCRESAQSRPLPDFLKEEVPVYEKVSTAAMKDLGAEFKQEVLKDPKIRKAVKKIKAQQSD